MSQKVTVAVKGTALKWQVFSPEGGDCGLQPRRTIDDHQRGLPQTSGIRMLKELSPGGHALPCHGLNRQEGLPPLPSHADGHQHRMDDLLPYQAAIAPYFPGPPHLAPSTAHHAFPDGSFEEGESRLLHLPRMGAGQISRRDQRLHPLDTTLVAAQHPGTPFAGGA